MFKFYRKITDGPRGQDIETDYYDIYLTNGKQQNRNIQKGWAKIYNNIIGALP
jgi:hypothetical protein